MSLLAENTKRWNAMKEKPSFKTAARKFASRAMVHKSTYEYISAEIKQRHGYHIPWWLIPLVHERECVRGVDNWNCNIAQGSAFAEKSRIVPYNGPFASFVAAAIAALVEEAPYAAKNINWSGGGTMTIAEKYNGLKYARSGKASPYVWSGTDQYVSGKVLQDHGPIEYYKNGKPVIDTQLGIAISLRAMMELDPTIVLDGDHPGQEKTPRKTETSVVVGSGGGLLAAINALVPYYDLTWWDITGFVAATVFAAGLIIYFVNKHKKGQI